jgi:hypothetical protein
MKGKVENRREGAARFLKRENQSLSNPMYTRRTSFGLGLSAQ